MYFRFDNILIRPEILLALEKMTWKLNDYWLDIEKLYMLKIYDDQSLFFKNICVNGSLKKFLLRPWKNIL